MSAWIISMNHPFLFHKKIRQSECALACSYVINSTWLISFKLANQHARKVLFTCVEYNNNNNNNNNSNNNSNNKYNNNNNTTNNNNN